MATTKAEPTEETTPPKKDVITFAKGATAAEKMTALKLAKEALETEVIDELTLQKTELEKQLAEVNKQIEAITGPPIKPTENEHPAGKQPKTKKEKTIGIKVSATRLLELVKEAGGELSIRGGKDKPAYDLDTIKKLVEESGGKFKITRTAPAWPMVSLA